MGISAFCDWRSAFALRSTNEKGFCVAVIWFFHRSQTCYTDKIPQAQLVSGCETETFHDPFVDVHARSYQVPSPAGSAGFHDLIVNLKLHRSVGSAAVVGYHEPLLEKSHPVTRYGAVTTYPLTRYGA